MEIMYGDKSLLCLENHLLDKFKEKCDLFGINYKINNSNFQILPALTDKTFVLYLFDKIEIIKQFSVKLQNCLLNNDSTCISCNNLKNIKYANFLDANLILCFSYDSNNSDNFDMKFITPFRNKDTLFASSLIKNLAGKTPQFKYSITSCRDYIFNTKYWPILFYKKTPVFVIEFCNIDFIDKNSDKLVNLISSSIIDKFEKHVTNLEYKITSDLIREIYLKIKSENQLKNTEKTSTKQKKIIKKNKTIKFKKRKSNNPVEYPFKIPNESPVYNFNNKNCKPNYPISTFQSNFKKNNLTADKNLETTLKNFKNIDTDSN